ncbi:MAG TPA: hypothetical protein VNL37_03270 [Candidatus Polarisedimenticolia bacterium]|nr:hypothetical protein [Candidatus Polarisedimenticolia bacterium]
MKRFLALVVCLWPAAAFAQQTYSNADLVNIQVPGAYTNDDLRRLPPLAIQKTPAAQTPRMEIPPVDSRPYQAAYDNLQLTRRALQAELDFEMDRIAYSESAFAGNADELGPRAGYRARVRPLILELRKRVALLDRQLDDLEAAARRAGADLDLR